MDAAERAAYVERWARLLEAQGQPRIAGRIYAQLATSVEPYLSLNDLATQLGVSRGSISTNTRRLIDTGFVTRVAVPGSRREHYAADADAARSLVERAAAMSRAIEALAREGMGLQPDAESQGVRSLRAIAGLYAGVAAAFESQIARGQDSTALADALH